MSERAGAAAIDAGAPAGDPIPFRSLPGWCEDAHDAALSAFRRSAEILLREGTKTRALGPDAAGLLSVARRTAALPADVSPDEARAFFEAHFDAVPVGEPGFVTAYYEPEVAASRTRTAAFAVPLYRRPPELVRVGPGMAGWDPAVEWARLRPDGAVEPFPDRAAIEAGCLARRGLELAWLADPVDAFFIHVQGSARLRMADGEVVRIGFDGKSGHPYISVGRLAVERGLLPAAGAHKDGLEAWLKANRAAGRALMRENRSYIFFRETRGLNDGDGPVGAAGVPLTPGRSLAVDRALRTFHTPVWVAAEGPADPDAPARPFRRLMVAQDTGSAILGAARGDLFAGSGAAAGHWAARVRHPAEMVVLVPRRIPGR
ncbi:murein transglycosylase A [Faunimonas sp. B44]|uniref:murein transglycosylase A n=1 Tax=Faunimonas sp. B44 TaxID=3461493 RepID=UPI004044A778